VKNICPNCGKPILKKTSTYHYKESGLDHVYLENVSVYECPCGTVYPSVFRVARLHELIAKSLLEKSSLLEGKELRFLRKTLLMSSKSFSQALNVGLTTYSKWENNRQQHSATNDRAIRAIYIILKGIQTKEGQRILENLAKTGVEQPKKSTVIVATRLNDDYVVRWRLVMESQGQAITKVWVGTGEVSKTSSGPQGLFANLYETIGKSVSSIFRPTETIPHVSDLG
jgi:YgiT-type zinc finger domain-containing protein